MRSESRSLRSFSALGKIARPEWERSWPRLVLPIGLSLLAAAIFLLVASNVLLLGLRAHDGGLHLFDILTLAPQFGSDKRLDRWLTIGFLVGAITTFGLLGVILRARPRPLHGAARFATPREIEAAGLRAKNGSLARPGERQAPDLRRNGACHRLCADEIRQRRRGRHPQSPLLERQRRRARRQEGEFHQDGGLSRRARPEGLSLRSRRSRGPHGAL